MSDPGTSAEPVDILLLGNVTRDLIDEHNPELYRLGGTVTFAACVADRLGRKPTVITRASSDTDLSAMPPSTRLIVLPSETTTTFANIYTPHGRVQYCFTPAPPIDHPMSTIDRAPWSRAKRSAASMSRHSVSPSA